MSLLPFHDVNYFCTSVTFIQPECNRKTSFNQSTYSCIRHPYMLNESEDMKKAKKEDASPLTSSLLDSPPSPGPQRPSQGGSVPERPRRNTLQDRSKNEGVQQAYANNQPKIMLETINARTITVRGSAIIILL